VYQRRIAGTPCAAVFVGADGAARLLGLTRQLVGEGWLGAREFQYAGSIAPYPATRETLAQIGQIGNVLASQFQLAGLFGVDLVIDAATQRVWALEVNPRYTASVEIVERATGVAAIEAHAVACGSFTNGLTLRATRLGTHDHGKAILFAKRPVVVGQMFATWALDEATRLPWPMLADVPPAGARIGIGRPVLTLFAAGEDSGDVERRLRKRVAEVETRLYVE
jgi:predicted ATP-grasp superfamily ATP-dependent carboligase